ncbi:MAG: DNA polymerase III subunit delta [bacterium]
MLIFLYGQDTYRSRQKLNEMIGEYKSLHKKGLNFIIFDGAVYNFPDLKNEIGIVSMFSDKKLIIAKNIFSNLKLKDDLLKSSEKLMGLKDIILFYEDGKVAASDALLRFLKKEAKCQEFEPLSGQKLKNWIKLEFEKQKAKASPDVAEKLFISYDNDLWRLANDIKKLAVFKLGQKEEINMTDFRKLVKTEIESDIFKTIEAAASKNVKLALSLLHGHLQAGADPLYLLSMLNYQFRNISEIRSLIEKGVQYQLIAPTTKLHPFVVRKTYALCQKFTMAGIKKIYQSIFQADLDIKTGKVDAETALDLLISGI